MSSPFEVLRVFLRLGMTCFGGPIAHIGYFRQEFVVRRHWLDEPAYADLVALCQFLPGPASSQVALCVGLLRAGYGGALAAWIGFTLPSAIIMVLFAFGARALQGPTGVSLLHGLKLVAVAIVAQAVWGMARTLCPDRQRVSIALVAVLLILFSASGLAQVLVIAIGALLGWQLCRDVPMQVGSPLQLPISRPAGVMALVAFFALLVGLPALPGLPGGASNVGDSSAIAQFDAFYHSGALVFGGGHVVLPLLRAKFVTPGWVSEDAFLAGYGAAQAVPGPLFTFAAYLGAVTHGALNGVGGAASPRVGGAVAPGIAGAALGLVAIFLPGVLVLFGALPFWDALRQQAGAQAAMRGVNAAVVGVLGAALYDPLWTSAVATHADFGIVLVGFVLLTAWRAPPLLVVVLSALSAMLVQGRAFS